MPSTRHAGRQARWENLGVFRHIFRSFVFTWVCPVEAVGGTDDKRAFRDIITACERRRLVETASRCDRDASAALFANVFAVRSYAFAMR